MDPRHRLVMNLIVTPVGGATFVAGFALMEGIAGSVVGMLGVSIIALGILTHLCNPPGRTE